MTSTFASIQQLNEHKNLQRARETEIAKLNQNIAPNFGTHAFSSTRAVHMGEEHLTWSAVQAVLP